MPANTEREELHRSIWSIADDLRGSVDGWDFKQYILGVMFYRYISEHLEKYIDKNEHESGNPSFSYAKLSDNEAEIIREEMVNNVGFFINFNGQAQGIPADKAAYLAGTVRIRNAAHIARMFKMIHDFIGIIPHKNSYELLFILYHFDLMTRQRLYVLRQVLFATITVCN